MRNNGVRKFAYWCVGHVYLTVPALQRTDMRLDAFLWACLLAILVHPQRGVYRVICSPQFQLGIMTVLGTIYTIALVHPMQLTKLAVQSTLMPLVVVPTVFLPNYHLSRLLELPPLPWTGRISYGLYLWQQLLFHGNAPQSVKTELTSCWQVSSPGGLRLPFL